MRKLVLAALVATLASAARVASAGGPDCVTQSEQAQQARTDGRLVAARELFHACANASCPAAVRTDCEKGYEEVDGALPSVVVIVRSGGRDVTDVAVRVDGEVVATKLDGRALAIDPGPHRVRIELPSGGRVDEQAIVVHQAEKNRVISFEAPPLPAAPLDPAAEPPPDVRRHTAAPWIVAGVGLAAAAAGITLVAVGQSQISASRAGCAQLSNGGLSCVPATTTSDGQDRAGLQSSGTNLSTAGIVAAGAGGALLVAGLVWHFLEPTSPRKISFAPLVGPGLVGASFAFGL